MTDCAACPQAVITEFTDFAKLMELTKLIGNVRIHGKSPIHGKHFLSPGQLPFIYWAWCLLYGIFLLASLG